MKKQIEHKQIVLIKIACSQLGIGDPEYRALLGREYDVSSCKDLSYEQASALIESLKERGFKIKPKAKPRRPQGKNIINMVSPQELAKLEHLRADIRWRHHNGYFGLMKKVIGRDRITTSKEASKMIECLKAMLGRQAEEVRKCGRNSSNSSSGLNGSNCLSRFKQEEPF